MRKTTLLLFGLFTLFACSEDVIQEMDEQTTGLEETPGPNSGDSGGNTVFTFDDSDPGWIDILNGYAIHPGGGYQSPWDIWFRNSPYTPNYLFLNDEGVAGHSSPFIVQFTPWVGCIRPTNYRSAYFLKFCG